MSITMWGAEQLALVRSAGVLFEVTEEDMSLRDRPEDLYRRECFLAIRDAVKPLIIDRRDIQVSLRPVDPESEEDKFRRERRIGAVVIGRWEPNVCTFRVDAPGTHFDGLVRTYPGVPVRYYEVERFLREDSTTFFRTDHQVSAEDITTEKVRLHCDGWDPIHRVWIYRPVES